MLSINDINLLKSQNEGLQKQIEVLQKENKRYEQRFKNLNIELNKRILSNNKLDYIVHCYHLSYEGARGAIQHLLKEDLTDNKTVKYYANVALQYLTMREEEFNSMPNIDGIKKLERKLEIVKRCLIEMVKSERLFTNKDYLFRAKLALQNMEEVR